MFDTIVKMSNVSRLNHRYLLPFFLNLVNSVIPIFQQNTNRTLANTYSHTRFVQSMDNVDWTVSDMDEDEYGQKLGQALVLRRAEDAKAAEKLFKQQTDINDPVNADLKKQIITQCTTRRLQVLDAVKQGCLAVIIAREICEFDESPLEPHYFDAFVYDILGELYKYYGLKDCDNVRIAFIRNGHVLGPIHQTYIAIYFDNAQLIKGDTVIVYPPCKLSDTILPL